MNALDEEIRQLLPRLRRFAVSLTRDPSSADDLVQNCLERALSRWRGKRAEGDLRAWLFSTPIAVLDAMHGCWSSLPAGRKTSRRPSAA
jgi:predicted RNA polymerase sigma factor